MKQILQTIAVFALSGCTIILAPSEEKTPADKDGVSFLSVESSTASYHNGQRLDVQISLRVNQAMPHVAPHIEVSARCKIGAEFYTDKVDAFFMSLSNAVPQSQKEDSAQLFMVPALSQKPERCELTLQLSEGGIMPHHFCFENGATKPGKCSL